MNEMQSPGKPGQKAEQAPDPNSHRSHRDFVYFWTQLDATEDFKKRVTCSDSPFCKTIWLLWRKDRKKNKRTSG